MLFGTNRVARVHTHFLIFEEDTVHRMLETDTGSSFHHPLPEYLVTRSILLMYCICIYPVALITWTLDYLILNKCRFVPHPFTLVRPYRPLMDAIGCGYIMTSIFALLRWVLTVYYTHGRMTWFGNLIQYHALKCFATVTVKTHSTITIKAYYILYTLHVPLILLSLSRTSSRYKL